MFGDPQEITYLTLDKIMARVKIDSKNNVSSATYATPDETFLLHISHTRSGGRTRTLVKVDFKKIVADPLTEANDFDFLSYQQVWDRPDFGFTQAELIGLTNALKAWTTDTALGQLYGRET